MEGWQISAEQLTGLMGPGATASDARDMADLLSVNGYPTIVAPSDSSSWVRPPVPDAVWDSCLLALLAVRAR